MYASTMDSLQNLYPKLSPGGFVIIDDYGVIAACRKAVDDFRAANNINTPWTAIDSCGIYWHEAGLAFLPSQCISCAAIADGNSFRPGRFDLFPRP